MFNNEYPGWFDTYELLKRAYTPLFGSVIFTGFPTRPGRVPSDEKWITCSATAQLQYICFANAIQVRHMFFCAWSSQCGQSCSIYWVLNMFLLAYIPSVKGFRVEVDHTVTYETIELLMGIPTRLGLQAMHRMQATKG